MEDVDCPKFFARISDTAFWDDKKRVEVLIDLYQKCDFYATLKTLSTKMCLRRSIPETFFYHM